MGPGHSKKDEPKKGKDKDSALPKDVNDFFKNIGKFAKGGVELTKNLGHLTVDFAQAMPVLLKDGISTLENIPNFIMVISHILSKILSIITDLTAKENAPLVLQGLSVIALTWLFKNNEIITALFRAL